MGSQEEFGIKDAHQLTLHAHCAFPYGSLFPKSKIHSDVGPFNTSKVETAVQPEYPQKCTMLKYN